ncbi:MAG: DUF3987 domain-containing protein, partial [Pseudomonadaceae bacterium]|nr:DUF3987 domain-containing protein [Pseudomonadaceae bacterium]
MDNLAPAQVIAQQTANPEYPEPVSLIPDANKPTPYPVDALPPILSDAIKAIAEFEQVPLALAGQAVLGAAGHVAQTRVDAWSHVSEKMPCTLWQLSLGASGEGKSSAYRQAFQPIDIREWKSKDAYTKALKEHDLGKAGLKGKALKEYDQTNPPPYDPTSVISGDGSFSRIMSMFVEGTSALFWNTDEGGQMLSGHSMKADNHVAVLGSLAKLWDDGKGERLRSKDNADGSGSFQGRRLSLSLMAQEVAIREVLNDPIMREQGFLPRFLFSAPESLVGGRKLSLERLDQKASDIPAITNYWARLDQLLDQPKAIIDDQINANALPVTQEAKEVWLGYWQHTEHQQARFNDYEALRPFASRAAQNTLRIATVLAFFDKRQQVDAEMMQAAYLIADHSLQEWKRYADAVVVDPATRLAQTALDWLLKESAKGKWLEFSGREWMRKGCSTGGLRNAKARDRAFTILITSNHLLKGINKEYRLNPLLLCDSLPPATFATPATSEVNQELTVATPLRPVATPLRPVATLSDNLEPVAKKSQVVANESQATNPMNASLSQESQKSQPLALANEKQAWTG